MYLYGASGHAKVIIDILKANHIEIEGLVDDNPNINELLGYPVFHGREDISPLIISIGDNKIRQIDRITSVHLCPSGDTRSHIMTTSLLFTIQW